MKLLLASEFEKGFTKIKPILEGNTAGKKAVFIPTAANGDGWKPDYKTNIYVFEEMGMTVNTLELEGMNEQEVYEELKGASVISVSGGNTFYLLEHMKKCNFKGIISKDEFKDTFYIGSSAGSVVMSPNITFVEEMDDATKADLSDYTGLGLINFFFLPHMDHPVMGVSAHKIANDYKAEHIRPMYDDQVIYIDDNTEKLL